MAMTNLLLLYENKRQALKDVQQLFIIHDKAQRNFTNELDLKQHKTLAKISTHCELSV